MWHGANEISLRACEVLVRAYLGAQGWQLAAADELALVIWTDSDVGVQPDFARFKARVHQEVWIRYAAILYAACRLETPDTSSLPPDSATPYQLGWEELNRWLTRQVRQLTPDQAEQPVLVQEALLKLHRKLAHEALDAPHAFFAYALKTLKNCQIDALRHRQKNEMKVKEKLDASEEDRPLDEEVAADQMGLEDEVAENETQAQLRAFFAQHLATPLQRQVAEMLFIHGLGAQAIAPRLSKQTYQIRLVKARIVKALRSLPDDKKKTLWDIIKGDQDDQ